MLATVTRCFAHAPALVEADLRLYGQAGGLPHSDFLPRLSVVAAARLAEIPAGAGAEQLRAL